MRCPPSALPFLLMLVPGLIAGQVVGTPAGTYLARYHELTDIAPANQVINVHHLVITRDAGQLTLDSGSLYLLASVGGHAAGALFRGAGRFRLAPSQPAEQRELRRFADDSVLDDAVTEAVLIFADSTIDQLVALGATGGTVPGDVVDHVHDALKTLEGKNEGAFDWGVLWPFLNGERNGLFVARLKLDKHGDALFEVDPTSTEAVQFYRPAHRIEFGTHWDLVTQFAPHGATAAAEQPQRLETTHYVLDANLKETFGADIDLSATAVVSVKADQPVGPWLPFGLQYKIQIDSGHWQDGSKVETFKAKDSGLLWVRAPKRLAAGDSLTLTLSYHANHPDLIDRDTEWFFIAPGTPWYPVNDLGSRDATFDVTYHSPHQYTFASVGQLTDSTLSGKVMTTHWIIDRPTPWATFNLGIFENHHVQDLDRTLDVMMSEDAHREIAREAQQLGFYVPQQSHMVENVTADVSNSLKYYTALFGSPPMRHFYVTEIPFEEGVSFQGFIDLAASTFHFTTLDGFEEWFRAHEVAHQWWGNGVEPATYRDYWLSEGLASFSALWYVAAERRHTDEYFKFLDQYQDDITGESKDVGPIWMGPRASTFDVPQGYQTMIYEKGAWVFHMLRIMMLDVRTMNEDRFTATLKDYYQTFQGKTASTADFQSVVERHAGVPMDWFFDEWVKGTGIPTYHVAWTNQPADNGQTVIKFRITQEHVSADFQMPVLISADLGENRIARFRLMVKGGKTDYQSPSLPAGAKKVTFNDLHSTLATVKNESW
ncbi:MAG TPA: M1 family aminopeptidase [Gemmatimonadales bacterium]|nr:M1 family aminopeptidase [Gemmatimonadales bacterium]